MPSSTVAAEGPVTVALIGPSGTGKTCLLHELAGCLGDHGFPDHGSPSGRPPRFPGRRRGAADRPSAGHAGTHARPAAGPKPRRRHPRRASTASATSLQARSPDPVVIGPPPPRRCRKCPPSSTSGCGNPAISPTVSTRVAHATLIGQTGGLVGRAVPLSWLQALERASRFTIPETAPLDRPLAVHPTPAGRHLPPGFAPPRNNRRVAVASTALAACFALAWAIGTQFSTPEPTTIATGIVTQCKPRRPPPPCRPCAPPTSQRLRCYRAPRQPRPASPPASPRPR